MIFNMGRSWRRVEFGGRIRCFLLNAILFFVCAYVFMFVTKLYSETLEENSKNLLNEAKILIESNVIFENYLRDEIAYFQGMSKFGIIEEVKYVYLVDKSEILIDNNSIATLVHQKKKLNFELTDELLDEWAGRFEKEQRIKLAYEKHMAARRAVGREKIKRAVALSARAKWFRFGWVL